jgi:hypothetical protein
VEEIDALAAGLLVHQEDGSKRRLSFHEKIEDFYAALLLLFYPIKEAKGCLLFQNAFYIKTMIHSTHVLYC